MESEGFCRFVLLDFGHPITTTSINNIINSLENVLALKLAFSLNTVQTLGISILNSDFRIFQSVSNLRKNYDVLSKNLQASLKATKLNSRVTVQEYKYSLSDSIEGVLSEFQKLKKTNIHSSHSQSEIALAIMTKKTASVLAGILMDVRSELQRNIPHMPLIKNYKIIQILNEQEKISKASDKGMLIDWTTCSDNIYDLSCFFKEWFLHRPQDMRIILSKELEVKCDVDDCMVNPISRTFDLFNDIQSKGSPINSSLGTLKETYNLKITNRLPVNSFCPTFGIPRRICATQSSNLKWIESQFNSKIFKRLCQELHQTGQGLLANSVSFTEKGKISKYHFLTSDGYRLLMNDVAPEELYLPARVTYSAAADPNDDETAASLVRACFEKIKLLNEYTPKNFPSGVYECLRNYLAQTVRKRKKNLQLLNRTGDYPEKNRKKRPKSGSEMERENVHPALLSPNVVDKYRKIHSQAFNLPELSKDYYDN